MLFIICETTGIVSANAKSKETDVVTRAEWLSDLVDTFEMTVEDDNYPDNYFSDLESSSEYYQKILVAVQFGVVNVEAGDPIYPNDPTTREFAASTLNFCLGYQMEKQDTTYTFSDSADVTDKDSAQIAVNHGWFTLIGGKFCPQNKVTSDEVTHMLADAKTIWNSTDVDRNYDSKYTLANGVIEIPEGTDTYLLDDGRVYIAECPKEISVGDSFAVHLNGIPCVYKAEKIEKDNSDYIITVSELSHDEAYKEADMQGTVDASALQIGEAADGLKVDYSEEKGNTVSRRKARGSVNLDKYTSLKVSGKIKVVDQSVSLDVKMKNVKIDYAISLTGETFVKLRGDSDVTCKCDFDAGKSMGLGEVPLLPAQIPGVGGIDLIMEVSFGGKFNYKTSGYLVTGLSYSKANGFRIIKNFNAKSFTVTCEANVSAGLKVRMGVTGSALPIKGYVYTTVGGKAVFRYASYNDGLPKGCTTVVAYVYASTGAEASIKLLGVDASISKETELYGEDNSPIRVYHHYEDGKEVIKCSRGNDFKYYTNINSRYWGNGWTEGIGDYGYDENGNKVPLYTYTLDEENNATITGYKGRAAYLHIPETVDGYTVVGIGSEAFRGNRTILSVDFPDSVIKIESYAFAETGLTELELPKNLQIMREHILQGNTGVKELTIPKTVTEMHTDRGAYFPKYGALEESGVETVVFEDGIAKIPYMAVRNAKNLTKIVISETVVKIESNAMEYCASLEKVDLPENVTEIGSCAFAETGLKQIILPNSIETLGIYTFRGCTSLTSITLSNKIEYIAARMFENCTSLETITLPDTVITINDNAFNGCTSLKNIEWGKSLKYINEYAFTNCTSLTNIKIPDTVEKIENGTFCNNSSLEKIELSKSLTWIGYRTFYNCDALTSIEIPDSVTDLGDQIFYDCDALTDVKLGTGIKKIPDSTFEHCDKLASIVLPYRVESIGNNVFKNDVALTEITIPRATTTIGSSVFSYLDKMTIYGVPGTYAETYAKENGIKFVSKEVKATKVTLDKNELTLNNGTRYTLKLSVEPEDFTDEVTWKSTNTDVATIDSDGVINARATGNAMIKVMVGEQNVTCNVKVVQPVISISLNRENLSLDALETHQLVPNIYPGNAENQNIEWKSEDETIATVSDAGLVKAVKEGTTTITATAKDGSGVTAKCTVTVKNTAYVVKNVEELESPHNYKNNCSDFWMYTMENESFLNVTFDSRTEIEDSFDYIYIYNADGTEVGKYTGKELSGATVKVTGDTVKIKLVSDGAGNAWGFKVSDIAGTSAKLPQSISVNEHINKRFNDAQFNLDAVSTVGDGVLSYRSEDTEVASVDNSGNVTIKGVGTVYIIITAAETDEYKETRKTVELVVDKAQQNPEIICNTDTIIEGQQIQIVTNNSIGDVVYESENTQIASINDTGLITGIAAGDVGINIIVEGNQYYESWTKRIILHVVKKQENIVLLTECEIKLSDTAYVYDGGEIRPEVTVSYNRTILTEGVDYILSYENNIDPGTATVTIEAAENSGYIGTVQKNFAIRAVLDEYVTVVQPGAFKGCANLTNVNIRSTVTGIGEQAFADCKNLRNIYFYGNCPETGKDMFQNVTANAYYPYNDLTWSMDKLQDYGGNITWCPWNPQTGEPARRDLSICEMTVSAKDLTYNGKAQTPQITVTDSGKVLQEGVDYTVTYENNVKAGTATVTATGAGIYGGSITTRFAISKASNTIKVSDITKTASSKSQTVKTTVRAYGGAKLTYSSNNKSVKVDKTGKLTIAKNFAGKAVITVKSSETSCYKAASKKVNVTVKPAAVTISKASNSAKQKITVSWKKNTTCSGYAVQYSTDKSFKKGVKTVYISKNSTVKATLSKLTKGKTYYVRIASYKKSGSTKIYSAWSKVKSVKVKK